MCHLLVSNCRYNTSGVTSVLRAFGGWGEGREEDLCYGPQYPHPLGKTECKRSVEPALCAEAWLFHGNWELKANACITRERHHWLDTGKNEKAYPFWTLSNENKAFCRIIISFNILRNIIIYWVLHKICANWMCNLK